MTEQIAFVPASKATDWRARLKRHPAVLRLWSGYRTWQQERCIRQENEYYRRRAREQNLPLEFELPELKRRLRHRLASRGMELRPKADLHFLYASPLTNTWAEHSIPRGLAQLGELTTFFLEEQGFADRGANWVNTRHQLDAALVNFVRETHARHPVDLMVGYLGGADIAPETVHAINAVGIPTCAIWMDDRLYFRGHMLGGRYTGSAPLASAYDLNLTNASSSIVKYLVEGGLAMFWPEAADPGHLCPLDLPFEYDVSFVGQCYGQRPVLVEYLKRNGVHVEAFGPGWPNGPLASQQMVEVYSRSRINLGMSGVGYSMKETCLKGRDFEVPMCGALYLTNDQPDLHRVYDVGREVVAYRDKADCLHRIRHLLAHPEECAKIRVAARRRCLRDHTWAQRFREVLEVFGLMEDDQPPGQWP